MPRRKIKISPKAKNAYIIFASVLIIAYLVNGYILGLGNLKFASEAESIFMESEKYWKATDLVNGGSIDLAKDDEFFKKMNSVSKDSLKTMESFKPPKRGLALQKELKEYFEISDEISANSLAISDYVQKVQKVNKDMETAGASGTDPLGDLEKWRVMIGEDLQVVNKADPKPSFKKTNEALLKDLENISVKLDDLIRAIKEKNQDNVKKATEDIGILKFESVSPTSTEILEDIISPQKLNGFRDLDVRIKSSIKSLKRSRLVLF